MELWFLHKFGETSQHFQEMQRTVDFGGNIVARVTLGLATLSVFMLAACGGGGGGVGSTPTPPVAPTPPPTATNQTITDLVANQNFSGDAATTTTVVSTPGGIVQSSSSSRAPVSVRYDAASKSYTIETAGRTQSFTPADLRTQRLAGEQHYEKSGSTNDYLTLVTTPYYGSTKSNNYVGMGYWQQNSASAGAQSTQFSSFTYGLNTNVSAVPRSGSARWDTDIFGLMTSPDIEIRTIQGRGTFDVDFANGIFSAFANVDEFNYITGGGRVGSLRFRGGGQLTSAAGFEGNFSYYGVHSVGGSLQGNFYGPNAEEIGATFTAQGEGSFLTGSMTGQRSTTASSGNLTLLNVIQEQRLSAHSAIFATQARSGTAGFTNVTGLTGSAFVTITPNGPGDISDDRINYTPRVSDLVAGAKANFDVYQSQLNGQLLRVSFYKPGNANTELPLTYASFATWSMTSPISAIDGIEITNAHSRHILYGIETPPELLLARTGTGSYAGVVYGSAASSAGALYDVSGTSRFDVDFSAKHYSGALDLTGKSNDGTSTSFGRFSFGNMLIAGSMIGTSFDNVANTDMSNRIQPTFFGPNGQEIGATFYLRTGPLADRNAVQISGVTVAKRQ